MKQLGGIYRAKEEFSGDGAVVNKKEIIMKLSTIALAMLSLSQAHSRLHEAE